jgi:hypothetical protein
MIMLATNLGPEYVVWDKAASIPYKKPGLGRVRAEFYPTGDVVDTLRRAREEAVRAMV